MARKVMIVDDDHDLLKLLDIRLRINDFEPVVAADAVTAMTVACREQPDLILLDLGLPGGDGYLVMERLKAVDSLKRIPVIVVSARDAATNREKSLRAGAAAFFQKPFDSGELFQAIRTALGDERDRPDAGSHGA